MAEELKICLRCKSEYMPHIVSCADCNIPLIYKSNMNNPRLSFDDSNNLVLIRTEEPQLIKIFAELLIQVGIPSIIKVEEPPKYISIRGNYGQGWLYGIYVRSEDESKARHLDDQYWKSLVERENKPPVSDSMNHQICPACNTWAGVDTKECPSCGLFLG
jgi:hypothetical protein